MNDFLHNLRMGQNKNFDRNRRTYDNNRYRNDRHNYKDKRKFQHQSSWSADQFGVLKKLLEELAENQKRLAAIEERRIDAEERKADALETIAEYVRTLLPQATVPAQPQVVTPTQPRAEEAAVDQNTAAELETPMAPTKVIRRTKKNIEAEKRRQQALVIINEMRENGTSYDKIARHLQELSTPTPSGRGVWRGQAVSKLYQSQ